MYKRIQRVWVTLHLQGQITQAFAKAHKLQGSSFARFWEACFMGHIRVDAQKPIHFQSWHLYAKTSADPKNHWTLCCAETQVAPTAD